MSPFLRFYPTPPEKMIINSYNFGGGASYVDEVLADNPLYYYRLGETTGGTAFDIGSQGRDASYDGGFTLGQASLLASDSAAKSVALNGSSGSVIIGDHLENRLSGFDSFTMEALVKFSSFPSGGPYWIYGKGYEGGNGKQSYYLLLYESGGSKFLNAGCFDGTTNHEASLDVSSWTTGTVYHVVGTYTYADTSWRIYADGVLGDTSSGSGAQPGSQAVCIGKQSTSFGSFDFLNGNVQEVAFYLTALSDERIAAHNAARF